MRLALMIAIGIGLHNLGEGLAIGSAYAVGELALGAALVVGFAVHNTTEGLAVVVPLTAAPGVGAACSGSACSPARRRSSARWSARTVVNAELSALLLGIGVGAIVQVDRRSSRRACGTRGPAGSTPSRSAASPPARC